MGIFCRRDKTTQYLRGCQYNIYEGVNTTLQDDPNQNCDTVEKLLLYAKTKHLTTNH